jgi:hypothetical protein
MLTTLLFIAIIISCKTYAKGFTKLSRFSRKTNLHARLTSTTFYDNNDDENDKRNKKYNYEYGSNFNNHDQEKQHIIPNKENLDDNEPFYTLIWFDCEDCKNILRFFKNERKQLLYINGGYYFFDENDETSTPLFYKDDELIATDVFGIYEEIFFKKINEE